MKKLELALFFLLLVTVLPWHFSYAEQNKKPVPQIFFSSIQDDVVFFGGMIQSNHVNYPFFGLSSNNWRTAYFAQIPGYIVSAVKVGDKFFFIGTTYLDGFPAILLVEVSPQKRPRLKAIYSDLPLYGVDLLSLNDILYITGYTYRYRPVRESDVILLKYNYTAEKIINSVVFGSIAFDDYPKRILFDGENIIIVGDTYAYNICLLYTSPSPRDRQKSRMPSSA